MKKKKGFSSSRFPLLDFLENLDGLQNELTEHDKEALQEPRVT